MFFLPFYSTFPLLLIIYLFSSLFSILWKSKEKLLVLKYYLLLNNSLFSPCCCNLKNISVEDIPFRNFFATMGYNNSFNNLIKSNDDTVSKFNWKKKNRVERIMNMHGIDSFSSRPSFYRLRSFNNEPCPQANLRKFPCPEWNFLLCPNSAPPFKYETDLFFISSFRLELHI